MSIMAASVNGLYSFRIVGICIGQSIDIGAKHDRGTSNAAVNINN